MVFFHRELKLRNYAPEDEDLKERQVPKAKPASGKKFSVIGNLWKTFKNPLWGQCCLTDCSFDSCWLYNVKYLLFAVEDKVKDQLEAANPEPIIEEVVGTPV